MVTRLMMIEAKSAPAFKKAMRTLVERFDIEPLSDFSAKWANSLTLWGSFSSVSTPNFARKYSLESSWRVLQDLHIFCTAQTSTIPAKFVKLFSLFSNLFCKKTYLQEICHFMLNFDEPFVAISRNVSEKCCVVGCRASYWSQAIYQSRNFAQLLRKWTKY